MGTSLLLFLPLPFFPLLLQVAYYWCSPPWNFPLADNTISMKVLKYKCKIPREGRTSSKNVATLNIIVHDVINLLHFEQRTDKGNYFYLLYSFCLTLTVVFLEKLMKELKLTPLLWKSFWLLQQIRISMTIGDLNSFKNLLTFMTIKESYLAIAILTICYPNPSIKTRHALLALG